MQGTGLDLALDALAEEAPYLFRIDCDFLNLVLTARPLNLPPGHQDCHRQYEFLIPLSSIPCLFVEDQEFSCLPGSLIPINPGLRHGVRIGRKATSFILVFVDKSWMDSLVSQVIGQDDGQGFPVELFPVRTDIQNLINRMIHEFHGSEAGRAILLRNFAEALAVLLIRHYHQPSGLPEVIDANQLTGGQFRFQRALAFMQAHYCLRMSIDRLAAMSSMNSFHFIRSFKKQFATSPYHYLTRIRITNARRLLAQTQLSVAQVGRLCGFPSASRFSAVFQKDAGLTPSRFRKLRKTP
jgi:AraC-like DNA-binding protein